MDKRDLTKAEIDHIDPSTVGDITESGELERPQPRRKIDCAGNPEIADRKFSARGSNEAPERH